ncbi:hypothetical protein ONS96_010814 [Cadophora gregata f. sp. sojae]|nr:hypothetical protein ONS96_010814 [Cadophora gregata f. sp. sojae]
MGYGVSRSSASCKSEVPRVNTPSLERSPFRLLPNELIHHIAAFLPRDAVASFALSCQSLRLTLPNSSFKLPWENKLTFLQLLERDLPGHIICRHCTKLHAMEKADLYLLTRNMRYPYSRCRWEQMWSNIDWYFHKGFSTVVFEMAVKQHRQRLDCSKLLELLSSEARICQKEGYVERHSAFARVVGGCLLIRDQRVCLMPNTNEEPLPRNARFIICPHFTLTMHSMERLDRMADQFGRPDGSDLQASRMGTGLIPCRYCHTEFQVVFRSFGEAGRGVSITTWKDVGGSLLDDKWRGHIGSEVDMVPFDRGSICTAFQNEDFRLIKPGWPLDSEVRKMMLKGKSSRRSKIFQ